MWDFITLPHIEHPLSVTHPQINTSLLEKIKMPPSLFEVKNGTVRKTEDTLKRHFFSDFWVLEQLTPWRRVSLRIHPGKRKGSSLSARSSYHTVTYRMRKVHSVMVSGRQEHILSRTT